MPYIDKQKQKEYQRLWIKKRRKQWIKENGPCKTCSSLKKLEVDHIDPTQKETNSVWSWSEDRRRKELSKCQVLCRKCHAIKTKGERKSTIIREHGEVGRYWRGCRCDECRVASAHYKRYRREVIALTI